MLVARDRRFGIQGVTRAREKKIRNKIRPTLRAVLLYRGAYNLAAFDCSTGFVVVSQPTVEKVPSQLLTDLWIARVEFWERLSGYVVEQFAIGTQPDLAGIFLGGFDVFFERPVDLWFFDFKLVPGFDSIKKVFSNHTLNLLPVLRADDFSGFEICVCRLALLWRNR